MRPAAPVLATLFALTISPLAAQTAVHACTLLTTAEIGSAVGGAVGQSKDIQQVIPSGPSKGETMYGCMWPAGDRGMVNLSMIRAAKGAQREAGIANMRKGFETLKARGWTEEKHDFGDVHCAILTPPAAQPNMPMSTGCFGEAKGMGIGLGAAGRTRIAIEAVKGLYDKVTKKL